MIKINGQIIGSDCFPNNERIFETKGIQDMNGCFTINMRYETDIDISVLIMCKKYLDDIYSNPEVTLSMKYIPYSRMDRKIDGYMFSLKYFCQLINDLKFNKVIVLDAHSNVSSGLIDRCEEISINYYINEILRMEDVDYIFYPDNGACKRYSEVLKLPENIPYFYGNKKRNLQTGEIIEYELVDCPNIKNKNILIIDDLCAKGFTFYNAYVKLKEKGANKIFLYVSHCEDTIYKGKLLKCGISRIFTTGSILKYWDDDLLYKILI